MAKDYKSLIIKTAEGNYEMLSALLSMYNFESFYETSMELIGYYSDELNENEMLDYVASLKKKFVFSYEIKKIENENWNAKWEASFDPIYVDNFVCVRAGFHDLENEVMHDIIINPKMSFGTGHHETTFMMMSMMRDIEFTDKKILDLGCGTSILAILAEKLGANNILAIDYDEICISNSIENIETNNCKNITIKLGQLLDVETKDFEVILANINRTVLLDIVEKLPSYFVNNGLLLLSGILDVDLNLVKAKYEENGFEYLNHNQRGEWICMLLKCNKAL